MKEELLIQLEDESEDIKKLHNVIVKSKRIQGLLQNMYEIENKNT